MEWYYMIYDYAGLVNAYTIELKLVKEKVLKQDVISSGLKCHCKRQLLFHYIDCVMNLMVSLTAFLRLVPVYTEDGSVEELDAKIKLIKKAYRRELSYATFAENDNNRRMSALFLLLQILYLTFGHKKSVVL